MRWRRSWRRWRRSITQERSEDALWQVAGRVQDRHAADYDATVLRAVLEFRGKATLRQLKWIGTKKKEQPMSVLTSPDLPVAPLKIPAPIEPDDLLKLDGLCELVDGQIIEKGVMGFRSGVTFLRLAARLDAFLGIKEIGAASCETTFRCFPEKPKQVRRPDISFISAARLGDVPDDGHVPIRPDLVIEVVSPDDRINDLEDRLADFRSVGVPLIWIVYPHPRLVRIFRPGERIEELTETEELRGEGILPGFNVALRDLFPSPASLMK